MPSLSAIAEIVPRSGLGWGGGIFTIGHSTHELSGLVALLRRHRVRRIADVRAYPSSRRVPQFNSQSLAGALAAEQIDYVHLPALGGRRRPSPGSANGGWRNAQFRGYADHMSSEEFEVGLEGLLAAAGESRTAIMCAEAAWWRCHRRLVADALVARGIDVWHIGSRGELNRHELTSFAVVDGPRVSYPPAQAGLEL